ncbi:MAG TPA: glycerophosphodiester phosphodiesterase [Acidimicrobiales bacterium]|nr:glycerophosphodiester phosphodiesterase [Acidimicrobiales bacterium]
MKILGHRGASAEVHENTLEAFTRAFELGADGVELDVRRTKDGALVVHHDAAVVTGRLIVESNEMEVPLYVPHLEAALDVCPGFVNIEIKNVPIDPDFDPEERVAAGVVAMVRRLKIADRVVVSSFGLAAIDAVRAADPSIPTGWLTISAYDQLQALRTVVEHGHGAIHPHHTAVTTELAYAARDAGVVINTWTVDDPVEMCRLADLGVNAIITNDVALALQTLRP